MPTYVPIWIEKEIEAERSDLDTLTWRDESIVADFFVPDDLYARVRVSFARALIVRVIREMPLSTEDSEPPEGLVPNHFDYTVSGSHFYKSQSFAFRESFRTAFHYQFITGSTCLDVIAEQEPLVTYVQLPPGGTSYRTH